MKASTCCSFHTDWLIIRLFMEVKTFSDIRKIFLWSLLILQLAFLVGDTEMFPIILFFLKLKVLRFVGVHARCHL